MSEIKLTTPVDDESMISLNTGDRVLINGVIYTGRDAAHKRMVEALDRGEDLPIDIRGQIIYYAGPAPTPPGKPIGSVGPTTSYRMDPYAPRLIEVGLKGMIGKGPRAADVREAMVKYKSVYFAAIGGAAAGGLIGGGFGLSLKGGDQPVRTPRKKGDKPVEVNGVNVEPLQKLGAAAIEVGVTPEELAPLQAATDALVARYEDKPDPRGDDDNGVHFEKEKSGTVRALLGMHRRIEAYRQVIRLPKIARPLKQV